MQLCMNRVGAGGGIRTHMGRSPMDFESIEYPVPPRRPYASLDEGRWPVAFGQIHSVRIRSHQEEE